MNQSARKEYFEQNAALAQCFETVDGILFKTEAEANAWNSADVTTWNRADFINEDTAPVQHKVTNADLADASSIAETFGANAGEIVLLQQ